MLRRSGATFADGGRTVVLGPGSSWRAFLFLRPLRGPLILLAVLVLVLSAAYGLRARADTAEYYPSSCLGTWEGVEHALGETELDGSLPEEFTGENSARFPGGFAQVFCGNFVGDIDAPSEAQVFRSATLSFVWTFRFPDEAAQSSTAAEALATSTDSAASSSPAEHASGTAPGASLEMPPEIPTSSLPNASGSTSFWPLRISRAWAQEAPPASPSPGEPVPPAEPDPAPAAELAAEPMVPPSPSEPTAPNEASSSFPVPPPGGEPTAPPAGSSTEAVLIEASSTATSTLDIPWSITSPAADPTVVGGSEEDVFQITVSLDGKEWTSLGTVSRGNWRDGVFSLPIASWADLARLQVSVRGLSSPERPEVFLDGMRVEVDYEQPGALGEIFGVRPEPLPPLPPPPPVDVPEAKHRCVVTPFAETIRSGGQAAFSVELFPSADGLPYQVALGDLPEGVAGILSAASGSPPVVRLGVSAGATTTPGSFSSVIVYRETDASGTAVSTVCQYNLILAP